MILVQQTKLKVVPSDANKHPNVSDVTDGDFVWKLNGFDDKDGKTKI